MRQTKLRLGIFLAPFHGLNENPTLCFERDLEFTQYADELGLSEFWFGEHHTGGYEIISSPELMIAAAAQRTKRIKLGTGVVSLPYHNPLNTASRIAQLDHLTRGRLMFGAGPGLLTADAYIRGLDARESRDKLDQGLSVITRLLRGEWVTEKTDWYDLREAHCQLLPTAPLEVCVASAMSPNGGALAGKYAGGMLCLAATIYNGFDALAANWQVAQETAATYGRVMNPGSIRLVTDMHIAETREQARANVRYGLAQWADYFGRVNPMAPRDTSGKDLVDQLIDNSGVVIGTPDDAIAKLEALQAKQGEFGAFLQLATNWADFEATKKSYDLFARFVRPHFTGANVNRRASLDWVTDNGGELSTKVRDAAMKAFVAHEVAQKAKAGA